MYFDEEFVKSLPDDWNHAALKIKEKLYLYLKTVHPNEQHAAVQQLRILLKVLEKRGKHSFEVPDLSGQPSTDVNIIKQLVDDMARQAEKQIQKQAKEAELKYYENAFEMSLESAFHFEFSEGNLKRIGVLIKELRDLIPKSEEIEENHKTRLLAKLEKFQSELSKKMPDLDRALGFLIEAGLVIGPREKNAAQMYDALCELGSITGCAFTKAYELPSDFPIRLPGQSGDEFPKKK
ncbi:MAG: hypothetical protein P8016_04960 [Sedimentisphaerales bacterium]